MALTWNAPTGARVQPPHYPVPQTLLIAGLMNHVYEHDYAVLQTFTIPADARQDEQLAVSVKAEWLACTVEICVPESAELRTTIKVHARQPGEAPQPIDHQFDTWNSRLPAPLGAPVHFAIAGDTIRLAIPLPASQALPQPHLFIGTDHVVAGRTTRTRIGERRATVVDLQVDGPDRVALFGTGSQTFHLEPIGTTRVIAIDLPDGVLVIAIEPRGQWRLDDILDPAGRVLDSLGTR